MNERDKKEIRDILKPKDDTLKVCEIFTTVQGEGPTTGVPVTFLRLSTCNLTCIWCDTPYTWNWVGMDFKHDTKSYEQKKYDPREEIKLMTPQEIIDEINMKSGPGVKTVVLTGGEPLMQQKSKAFIEMLELLKKYRYSIEIETNGTLAPTPDVLPLIDQFNVSPKLSNSGNDKLMRMRTKALNTFNCLNNAWFKFVVMTDEDMEEIQEFQKEFNIKSGKILLMPEGRSNEETQARAQDIVNLCIKYGYRFCNRLHVWIWDGAQRGV
jgi:organic radical activating enzyme